MIPYYGDFAEDATVYIPFSTFTSDDPAISSTISEFADADIKVHKDGAATPITTDGATVVINLNSATGAHMITIATNADAAYSTGSEYSVRIEGVTIDGGADIDAWVGSFSVERAGGALAQIKALITTVGTAGAGLGDLGGMSTAMKAEAKTEAAGALTDYDAPTKAEMDSAVSPLATTAELNKVPKSEGSVSWNSTALASINAQADTALSDYDPPTNTEMVAAFTEIKGASWATTDSLEAIRDHASTIKAETVLIVADTDELQAAWVDGGRLDVLLDAIPTTAMRGTDNAALASEVTSARMGALTDWINGGRLDLLLDGIPTTPMRGTDNAATEAKQDTLDAVADQLNLGIIYGAAETGTLSTTVATSGLTGYADDQLIGAVIIFTSGACEGERTNITDYASAGGTLTFTALTTAPGNGDTFKIV
jgi:hypothetical protein